MNLLERQCGVLGRGRLGSVESWAEQISGPWASHSAQGNCGVLLNVLTYSVVLGRLPIEHPRPHR